MPPLLLAQHLGQGVAPGRTKGGLMSTSQKQLARIRTIRRNRRGGDPDLFAEHDRSEIGTQPRLWDTVCARGGQPHRRTRNEQIVNRTFTGKGHFGDCVVIGGSGLDTVEWDDQNLTD
jgi:hypothetical protein